MFAAPVVLVIAWVLASIIFLAGYVFGVAVGRGHRMSHEMEQQADYERALRVLEELSADIPNDAA